MLSPIFAEIVPEKSRTSIYALDRSFESILSSFAPPVVGILAQHVYGYKPVSKGSTITEEIATDRANAASLAKALYVAIAIPIALCCIIYSFLYSTYPRDKERAQMQALVEAEMHQLEADNLIEGQYSLAEISKSDELLYPEDGNIEMDYKLEDDDNDDDKMLLHHQT